MKRWRYGHGNWSKTASAPRTKTLWPRRSAFPGWRWSTETSPFGAVLVKDGAIVFHNENQIYTRHDPTFHGEAGLIRRFCEQTGITDLRDYTLYSSCEPCFMCSGAMVWVRLGRLVYGASNDDLEHLLGNEGCNCSRMVFEHSFGSPRSRQEFCARKALPS